jgi:hypothetical protein
MHPSSKLQSKSTTVILFMTAAVLWLLVRGYHGLTGDGQIYAFQAFARLHPHLAVDLYLQNTSQDQFTIFSIGYAWFIQWLGLEQAARCLALLTTFWLLLASWSAARALAGRDAAWLAVASLLIVNGSYGGSGVFHISEQFLTARLPAEALVATALACHLRNRKTLAVVIATATLLVHPLIGLPGLLLLLCLKVANRTSLAGALLGVAATLLAAAAAATVPAVAHRLPIMDPAWLGIVRERSQFLFLPLWSFRDWDLNIQPFLYLSFAAIAVPDERIRKLCFSAGLVGAAGLMVAMIAGTIGPVALLVQGQAWRWVWIAAFLSALLLPAVILQIWKAEKGGALCALLLIAGWTVPAVSATACVSIAIAVWALRPNIDSRVAAALRWAAYGIGAAMAVWALNQAILAVKHAAPGVPVLPEIFKLKICAAMFTALAWSCVRFSRSIWTSAALAAILLTLSIATLPTAFKQARTLGAPAEISEFSDWRDAIPPTSTVLLAPPFDVGAFVWFTLQRPNYLALDQSAGAVFSRPTALEIARRSDVLLPVTDPDWRIMSNPRAGAKTRPLTAESLVRICTDPQLSFVVSPQDVGYGPLRHAAEGARKNWNLYDCRRVRLLSSPG